MQSPAGFCTLSIAAIAGGPVLHIAGASTTQKSRLSDQGFRHHSVHACPPRRDPLHARDPHGARGPGWLKHTPYSIALESALSFARTFRFGGLSLPGSIRPYLRRKGNMAGMKICASAHFVLALVTLIGGSGIVGGEYILVRWYPAHRQRVTVID